MHNLRHHWVKAHLKDTFFAGMPTSGRSESIHSLFYGYVNASTMLNGFVQQYDKAVKARWDAEEDEDFRTINSKVVLSSMHPIEEHAGVIYTRRLFELFEKEWKASIAFTDERLSKDGSIAKYIVGLHSQVKCQWRTVGYDKSRDISATCICAKFETDGILCKHILYIMRKKNLQIVPKHYILLIWTIDARYHVGSVGEFYDLVLLNENVVDPLTLGSARKLFSQEIKDARNSPNDIQEISTWLRSFLETHAKKKKANEITVNETLSQVGSIVGISQLQDMDHISIHDLVAPIKTKGRPKIATRNKSGIEFVRDARRQ